MKYETRIADGDPNKGSVGLTKATIDRILKQENAADLLALYTFLSYTARWQETTQPKATVGYIGKALSWSERTVQRRKGQLREIGLIEDVAVSDREGKVTGWFVKVKYLVKVENHGDSPDTVEPENHGVRIAGGGFQSPKCLVTGKGNASKLVKRKQEVEEVEAEFLILNTIREEWEMWKQSRKENKKPLTPTAVRLQLKDLTAWGPERAKAALLHCVKGGYQGLFEPHTNSHAPAPVTGKPQTEEERRKLAASRRGY